MPKTLQTPVDDFDDFMEQRAAAASAYVTGDASPLTRLLAVDSPATFFAPRGGAVQGATEVGARYVGDAHNFHSQGSSRLVVKLRRRSYLFAQLNYTGASLAQFGHLLSV